MPDHMDDITLKMIYDKLIKHYTKYEEERPLIIVLMPDEYGKIGSIYFSVNGSPPKGMAIYVVCGVLSLYTQGGKRFRIIRLRGISELDNLIEMEKFGIYQYFEGQLSKIGDNHEF